MTDWLSCCQSVFIAMSPSVCFSLCLCLLVYSSVGYQSHRLSLSLPTCLFLCLPLVPICPSLNVLVCAIIILSVWLSVDLVVNLPFCLSVLVSDCPSIQLLVCAIVSQSVCMSVPYVWLFVNLPSVSLTLCLVISYAATRPSSDAISHHHCARGSILGCNIPTDHDAFALSIGTWTSLTARHSSILWVHEAAMWLNPLVVTTLSS